MLVMTTVYGLGGLVAGVSGWLNVYLRSPSFILGSFGIAWVVAAVTDRERVIDRLYVNLGDLFEESSEQYFQIIRREFHRISDWRLHVMASLPIVVIFLFAGWEAYTKYPIYVFGQELLSLRPWSFDPAFYAQPGAVSKFVVLCVFAAVIALCLGMTCWLMLREVLLVARLRAFHVIPLPEAVRSRLRPLADFHAKVAADWGLGAVAFFILFWRSPDLFSIAVLTGLSTVCFVMFVVPQVLLSRVVRNSHERVCSLAIASWHEADGLSDGTKCRGLSLEQFSELSDMTARPTYWVYSTDELWRWMSAQTLAAGAVVLQILIQSRAR
jgi:hypothetical protein